MRVYQCDRCGAIIKGNEKVTKLQLEQYIDGGYVDGSNCKRDLCKACTDRLLREASGETVGQPDGMINAERLMRKIAKHEYLVRQVECDLGPELGMTDQGIMHAIKEELRKEQDASEENDNE